MREYVLGIRTRPHNDGTPSCVLIRKARPEWQKGKLNVPGGKVEENEPPLFAMTREWVEETGIVTDPLEWNLVARVWCETDYAHPQDRAVIYVYHSEAHEFEPEPHNEDESEPVFWQDFSYGTHAVQDLDTKIPALLALATWGHNTKPVDIYIQ